MNLSLTTPKRRVVTPDGTIFFNEFYDTLHVERSGGTPEPIALNLGSSNWTVSDAGEVAFFCQLDDQPHVVIVHPARRTRILQPLTRHPLLDLLLLEDRFVAAIPGYLVLGRRTPEGALSWTGMRALDCGTEFHFHTEPGPDGKPQLVYAKRGSCLEHTVALDTGEKAEAFSAQRLQRILFRLAFAPVFLPQLSPEVPTLSGLLELFRQTAQTHPRLTEPGLRLMTLLFLLDRLPGASFDTLSALVRNDAVLQYAKGLDEPFPTMSLLQDLVTVSHAEQIVPGKLIQPQVVKWSRAFECAAVPGRRARLIRKIPYQDIPAAP